MTTKQAAGGPLPPYGVPIRDAIVRGDLVEMKALFNAVKPALEELEVAIAKIEKLGGHGGLRIPYGPPIRDAIARGDLQEMKATAEAARHALYEVDFHPATRDNEGDVRKALEELETAIHTLQRTTKP
jgi:hypothetical protein